MKADITTKQIGDIGEDAAVKFLKKKGYRILERNFRAGRNEIDIIARYGRDIVFVEVKTRTPSIGGDLPYGDPLESVDQRKQKRTMDAASAYLYQCETELLPRFDIIEVYLKKVPLLSKPVPERIRHIEDAFGS